MSKIERLDVWDVQFHEDCIDIAWSSNIGFGHLTIYHDNSVEIKSHEDIKYDIDSECMGKEFTLQVIELAKQFIIKHMNILD